MFNLNYFKADSSTFIIKSVNGKIRQQGKGLSFGITQPQPPLRHYL